jgi:hypothetical protein
MEVFDLITTPCQQFVSGLRDGFFPVSGIGAGLQDTSRLIASANGPPASQ